MRDQPGGSEKPLAAGGEARGVRAPSRPGSQVIAVSDAALLSALKEKREVKTPWNKCNHNPAV